MISSDAEASRIRWISFGFALIILLGLLFAAWYAIRTATGTGHSSQRLTRRRSLPQYDLPFETHSASRRFPAMSSSPSALSPMSPTLMNTGRDDTHARTALIAPLRDLMRHARESDVAKFWQGESLPSDQVTDAGEALATLTALTTHPNRFPPSLQTGALAVSNEMRRYLKVTEMAAAHREPHGALRDAALAHLEQCEREIRQMEQASFEGRPGF